MILLLQCIGISDILHFDFIDPPPVESIMRGMEHLYALGALNDEGELTKTGRCMAEFPCDPTMSKSILGSAKYGCVSEILTICAMLDVSNSVYYRPKGQEMHADNAHKGFSQGAHGDHVALMNVYNQWRESWRGCATAWRWTTRATGPTTTRRTSAFARRSARASSTTSAACRRMATTSGRDGAV